MSDETAPDLDVDHCKCRTKPYIGKFWECIKDKEYCKFSFLYGYGKYCQHPLAIVFNKPKDPPED